MLVVRLVIVAKDFNLTAQIANVAQEIVAVQKLVAKQEIVVKMENVLVLEIASAPKMIVANLRLVVQRLLIATVNYSIR
uniref:Uncharacterized protein n=1 Tax=Megaselia scalaris TaxID=36166 RepID=T1H1L6_MEGSC